MPQLRIRPAVTGDGPALQQIRYDAFRPGPISQALWPGEMSEDARQKAIANVEKEILDRGVGTGAHVFIVVAEVLPDGVAAPQADGDEDLSRPDYAADAEPVPGAEVVAFAKWNLHAAPRDGADWDVDPPVATHELLGDGMNLELWDAFIGEMKRMRRRIIGGQAHFLLDFLATSPARQRLGAAGALMRWGTARADARKLQCWIEATPAGYPLYRRHGFNDVAAIDLDIAGRFGQPGPSPGDDWGLKNGLDALTADQAAHGEGWYRVVLMQRPAA